MFDAREAVITDDLLNEYITNVTISALSLNTWQQLVSVTTTKWRNTYDFSEPLNLILPYALSLTFALISQELQHGPLREMVRRQLMESYCNL